VSIRPILKNKIFVQNTNEINFKADLFSGALFIKLSLDLDLYLSIGILLIISAFFAIGGGATAVIWTGN
jgi:low affinity sodium-glucose cotransporter 4